MHNLWDKQANESAKAYQRFAQYRDIGAGRSLRKLAKDLELSPSTLAEISTKHEWRWVRQYFFGRMMRIESQKLI
jgi:tRNA A37 threonylcarbamoyltransferase TsaD